MKVELYLDINKALKDANYKFLGWQNEWSRENDSEDYIVTEYRHCRRLGHTVDHVSHNPRGTENTASCDICKIYWKYDSSD